MLLRQAELDAIRTGEIDLAFRRWERPRLRAGTLMRTAIGLVEVTKVERIAPARISDRQARRAGAADREVLLARLDRRNPAQPIFRIGLRFAGPDPRVALRESANLSDEELAQITGRLQRLDRARPEPWTRAMLELVEQHPATLAAELAARQTRDLHAFKRDVARSRSSASPSRWSAATASRHADRGARKRSRVAGLPNPSSGRRRFRHMRPHCRRSVTTPHTRG